MIISIAEICVHSPFKIIICLEVFDGIRLPDKAVSIIVSLVIVSPSLQGMTLMFSD